MYNLCENDENKYGPLD